MEPEHGGAPHAVLPCWTPPDPESVLGSMCKSLVCCRCSWLWVIFVFADFT